MKKIMNNSKKSSPVKNNYYRGSSVELPNVICMDELSYFDDESLERLHAHLQSELEKVGRSEVDSQPWEVEICYVQREMKIRNSRRIAHEKYVRTNPDAAYYFDNGAGNPSEEFDQAAN